MGSLTIPHEGPNYLDASGFIYSVERILLDSKTFFEGFSIQVPESLQPTKTIQALGF